MNNTIIMLILFLLLFYENHAYGPQLSEYEQYILENKKSDIHDNIDMGILLNTGLLQPYGSDDLGGNAPGPGEPGFQPGQSNQPASPTSDFDDTFGQPIGATNGVKIFAFYKKHFGIRMGYEQTDFKVDVFNGLDTLVNWEVKKNDFSIEAMFGKRLGQKLIYFHPYFFGGFSFVSYKENLVLFIHDILMESEEEDYLKNVIGLNLGGGAQVILFKYLSFGLEIWHQSKGFKVKDGVQPNGGAKEFNVRIYIGANYKMKLH